MIELKDFSIGYQGRTLLEDINVSIPEGWLTALLGRNGTGKSTLLSAMSGAKRDYSGSVIISGIDVRSCPQHKLATTISFVSTEKVRIPNMLCEDLVALGRAPYTNWIGKIREEDREIVRKSLETVGMLQFADKSMDRMSDGECQRIMIARALAQDTPVILLDEPTSFLDLPNRYELCDLLRRLAHEQGKTILFSTHELDIAVSICDSIALISDNHLIHSKTDDPSLSGELKKLFGNSIVGFNPEDGSITIRRRS